MYILASHYPKDIKGAEGVHYYKSCPNHPDFQGCDLCRWRGRDCKGRDGERADKPGNGKTMLFKLAKSRELVIVVRQGKARF